MKTLLALLLLIPSLSWGHKIDDYDIDSWSNYCDINPLNKEWNDKNSNVLQKREVHYSKCILDHSHESSLTRRDIKNACEVLANDKYKLNIPEPEPGRFIHKTSNETARSIRICHPH